MSKRNVFIITLIGAFVLSNLVSLPVNLSVGMFYNDQGNFTLLNYLRWELFFFAAFMLLGCVVASHKFASGMFQELLFIISSLVLIAGLVSYLIFTFIDCAFDFSVVDWFGSLDKIMTSPARQ